MIKPDPLKAGAAATAVKAPDPNRHPSGGTDAGATPVPFPEQVSGPQASKPDPVAPPVQADIEGSISLEQLQRRGMALAPGRAPEDTPAEALRPQATTPRIPFATADDNTMSLDQIKDFGIKRL